MIRKTSLCIILLLLLSGTVIFAGDSSYDGCFPHLGHGARAVALGGAYTAIADDLLSLYWNPAGIASLRSNQIITQRYDVNGLGVEHSVLGFGTGKGWALSWSRLEPKNRWGYSYKEDTLTFGTARKLNFLQVGVNSKVYHTSFNTIDENDQDWGLGIDVGLTFKLNANRFSFVARDLVNYLPNTDGVAREYELGYALINANHIVASGVKVQGQDKVIMLGYEQKLLENIDLRFGLNGNDFTAGVGINFQNIKIDYAYKNNHLNYSNIFTYQLSF